jgi:hypothetical protein
MRTDRSARELLKSVAGANYCFFESSKRAGSKTYGGVHLGEIILRSMTFGVGKREVEGFSR